MNLTDANRTFRDAPFEEADEEALFLNAIKTDHNRKEIIAILKSAGLLPE